MTARKSFLSSMIKLSVVIKADFGTLRISSPLLRSLTAPKPLLQNSPNNTIERVKLVNINKSKESTFTQLLSLLLRKQIMGKKGNQKSVFFFIVKEIVIVIKRINKKRSFHGVPAGVRKDGNA